MGGLSAQCMLGLQGDPHLSLPPLQVRRTFRRGVADTPPPPNRTIVAPTFLPPIGHSSQHRVQSKAGGGCDGRREGTNLAGRFVLVPRAWLGRAGGAGEPSWGGWRPPAAGRGAGQPVESRSPGEDARGVRGEVAAGRARGAFAARDADPRNAWGGSVAARPGCVTGGVGGEDFAGPPRRAALLP